MEHTLQMPVKEIEETAVLSNAHSARVTLAYLFFTFFKVGLVAFGGHMALISVVQRMMVEKDKILEDEMILNSIGVASFLPGPLAVNVVGQIGFHLRKTSGAIVSTVAVILPAFLIILLVAWQYFTHQQGTSWEKATAYIAGSVSAIILATGVQLFKKEVQQNTRKMLLFAVALLVLLAFSNYFVTVGVLIAGGIAGVLMQLQGGRKTMDITKPARLKSEPGSKLATVATNGLILLLGINQVLFLSNISRQIHPVQLRILSIFAGISLSLFGGGYVMIPIMESLFVKDLHWLSSKEFVDAIAFSQATPGPILISAAFIGYKVSGVAGAVLGTIAIFAPSVFLVIRVSRFVNRYKENMILMNMLSGIKTVVVALILVSAWRLLAADKLNIFVVAILMVSFVLNFKYKVSPVYIVAGAILFGVIKHLIH